jgi:alpha-galactosidase
MRSILAFVVLILPTTTLLASDPGYYQRKETWQETMRCSREALATRRDAGEHPVQALSPWKYLGPLPAQTRTPFAEKFPPEREVVLDRSYGNRHWEDRTAWQDGAVTSLGSDTMSAHFLYRTIQLRQDSMVRLSLGSDDGIKLWINGDSVLGSNTERGAAPDQEHVTLRLHAGVNALLMKIVNYYGPSGFYFAIEDVEASGLWDLVHRDFPDPLLLKEMAWEQADSIWSRDWRASDISALALRYAHRALCETPAEFDHLQSDAQAAATTADLANVRKRYLVERAAEVEPVILTPAPSTTPRINYPRIYGARPGHPFLFTVPVSGDRPMTVAATGLPAGLAMDSLSGVITGCALTPGRYPVKIAARNSLGTDSATLTIVIGSTIALTPPLGWNSWNCFAGAVDDHRVRSAADAMANSGLLRHGWAYINIDDCWEIKPGSDDPMLQGPERTPQGMINTNRKFPDMRALSAHIHAQGLKMGIYSSPGPLTCAGFAASYKFEKEDAEQYAAWGIDYLKYDWCSYNRIAKDRTLPELEKPYQVMHDALDAVQRDIVFSLCQYGMGNVWEWGGSVGGNSWRTTGDIEDTWESMTDIGFSQSGHEAFARPGNWNDPDMLVVGQVGWGPSLHPTRLTPREQYTHISLWCLLSSPLLIGCDMTQMDDFTRSLLTNDEVLAVSQDPLGRQARRVSQKGDLEVWAKELEDGSFAVGLFNRGPWKESVSVSWSELALTGKHYVRDLWRQLDLGEFPAKFAAPVSRHGVVLLRIK